MDIKDSPQFKKTISFLTQKLKDHKYAFRGTTSLVLQGVDMNVDDIDILCDKETANVLNRKLKSYLKKEIAYKESDKFRSYFGELEIEGTKVEVMGDWQIKDAKGEWSHPFDASGGEITEKRVNGETVKLTTVGTELKMYTLMGRWSALAKIKRQLKK